MNEVLLLLRCNCSRCLVAPLFGLVDVSVAGRDGAQTCNLSWLQSLQHQHHISGLVSVHAVAWLARQVYWQHVRSLLGCTVYFHTTPLAMKAAGWVPRSGLLQGHSTVPLFTFLPVEPAGCSHVRAARQAAPWTHTGSSSGILLQIKPSGASESLVAGQLTLLLQGGLARAPGAPSTGCGCHHKATVRQHIKRCCCCICVPLHHSTSTHMGGFLEVGRVGSSCCAQACLQGSAWHSSRWFYVYCGSVCCATHGFKPNGQCQGHSRACFEYCCVWPLW